MILLDVRGNPAEEPAAIRRVTLCLSLVAVAALIYLAFVGYTKRIDLSLAKVLPEAGHSYWVDLADLAHLSDTEQAKIRSSLALLEDGKEIGVAHSLHDDIRKVGKGRYSHWNGGLYFSTSDNTDPRTNGRHYTLKYRYHAEKRIAAGLLVLLIVFLWSRGALKGLCKSGLFKNETFLSVVIAVAVVSVLLFLLELGFRFVTPFSEKEWPNRFNPAVGFHFAPNAVVKHTNHLDFWITDKTNSLGFLDSEVPVSTANQCHISFIGDSFVEAAQVAIPQKVQRVVEKTASISHPDWHLTTSAFGYSGTGQLNQLPFYDQYVRHLSPRLVVLVFASNDYANNSAILESLRNGWHPGHSPRVYAQRDGNRFKLTRIDPDWQEYQLVSEVRQPHLLHSWLKENSSLYLWVWSKLSLQFPAIQSLEGVTITDQILARVQRLRTDPKFGPELTGWEDSHAQDLDRPFYGERLPPVYAEAIDATRFALQEFKRRADVDGTRLVVLAVSQLVASARPPDKALFVRRRLREMTETLGIPLIDQYDFILQKKGDPSAARFRHDLHWTEQGHRWAAEAVAQFLENKEICKPSGRARL